MNVDVDESTWKMIVKNLKISEKEMLEAEALKICSNLIKPMYKIILDLNSDIVSLKFKFSSLKQFGYNEVTKEKDFEIISNILEKLNRIEDLTNMFREFEKKVEYWRNK